MNTPTIEQYLKWSEAKQLAWLNNNYQDDINWLRKNKPIKKRKNKKRI